MTRFLALLSIALILRGAVLFFTADSGRIDFRNRLYAQRYVRHGVDPFRLPPLPSSQPARDDRPYNMVDPPWFFAFGNLLYLPWNSIAPAWFIGANMFALAILAFSLRKLAAGSAFCTAAAFANLGFGQQLINGNYGIFAVSALAASAVLLTRGQTVFSGIAMAIAQIKMTLAAPFPLLLLARRKSTALSAVVLILILSSLWTSLMLGIPVPGLIGRMLEGVGESATGGTSLWQAFAAVGIPTTGSLILSAALIAAPALWLCRKTGDDLIAQTALLAVCARIFTYHNSIDNIVLCFLVIAAELSRLRQLTLALIASVLIPARIGDIPPIQIALQIFWVVALLLTLRARRGFVPTQS